MEKDQIDVILFCIYGSSEKIFLSNW